MKLWILLGFLFENGIINSKNNDKERKIKLVYENSTRPDYRYIGNLLLSIAIQIRK